MRGMVPEDIYELTGCADPRISPDGTRVAYVVNRVDREANEYRSAIWMADVDGSSPPRQFTSGAKRDGSPRWSPDGERLAFVSSRDKDEPQLYVIAADGGEPRRLTDLDGGVGDPVWSPDGTRVLFSARLADPDDEEKDEKKRRPRRLTRLQFKLDSEGWTAGRRQHLFVVPTDGSAEPTRLTDGDFEDGAGTWAPDGTRIVFSSARDDDWDIRLTRDLYTVAADGSGEPERLTEVEGLRPALVVPGRDPHRLPVLPGGRGRPSPHPGGRSGPGLEAAHPAHGIPGPDLRPLPRPASAALGRGADPVRHRGPGRQPRVRGGGGRDVRAQARGGRGPADPRVRPGGRHDRPRGDVADPAVRDLRRRTGPDRRRPGLRRGTRTGRARAVHGHVRGRDRGRRVDPSSGRRHARRAPPGAAQHPRGALHAVRPPVLRRVPGLRGGRLRGPVFEPPGLVRVLRGLGRAIRGDGTNGNGWGSVDYQDVLAVVEEACRRAMCATRTGSGSWADPTEGS